MQKLLQELDDGSTVKAIKKKSKKNLTKIYASNEESSENEDDPENFEEKRKEEDNEVRSTVEENTQSYSKNQNYNTQKFTKSEKNNQKLANTNLLTNDVISDILDRLAELEKFRIYMEASAQTTDSKINF